MKLQLFLITVLASLELSLQQYDQALRNSVADYLVADVISMYSDSANLPDAEHNFPWKTGSISLHQGSIQGLSSASRVGDVKVDASASGPVEVTVDINLENLRADFAKYMIKAAFLKFSGHAIAIPDNIQVRVVLVFKGSACELDVKTVEFVTFGRFKVELISDCKVCDKMSEAIFNYVLNTFNTLIKKTVENEIKNYITLMAKDHRKYCLKNNRINRGQGPLRVTFDL